MKYILLAFVPMLLKIYEVKSRAKYFSNKVLLLVLFVKNKKIISLSLSLSFVYIGQILMINLILLNRQCCQPSIKFSNDPVTRFIGLFVVKFLLFIGKTCSFYFFTLCCFLFQFGLDQSYFLEFVERVDVLQSLWPCICTAKLEIQWRSTSALSVNKKKIFILTIQFSNEFWTKKI